MPPTIESLRALLDECVSKPRKQSTTIIGIDGRGGAGKSTLAAALAALDPNVTVVPTDHFYVRFAESTEIGAGIDWRLLIEQVLAPLRREEPGRYQHFDWDAQSRTDWDDVPTGGIVILDGVYSTRPELADYLSCRIWIDVPRDVGTERGIARDGEISREWWLTEWMPDEDRYVEELRPQDAADVVVDGSDGTGLFAQGQYLRRR